MEVQSLTMHNQELWDDFCEQSDDAWFWHTTSWQNYLTFFVSNDLIVNSSFMVIDKKQILAIVPSLVLKNIAGDNWLGFANEPSPLPSFASSLSSASKKKVEKYIFQEIEKLKDTYQLKYAQFFTPIQAKSYCGNYFPPADITAPYGYVCELTHSQLIDLRQDEIGLWSQMRKGHKSSIKIAQKKVTVTSWFGDVSDEEFDEYLLLHALAAGRKTRRSETFDLMKEWVRNKNALLIGGSIEGKWVGFVYVILYKDSVVYASACNDPDVSKDISLGHLLLWESIVATKKIGAKTFDLGIQTYDMNTDDAQLKKMIEISRFKRGFGGSPVPRFVSTREWSDET